MGLFDAISGLFTGSTAQDAAQKQIAGLQQGYGQASDLLGQGRGALQNNFTAALQPFMQNFTTGRAGQDAYADTTGANGPAGNTRATTNFQANPGYQFTLNQGTENVLRNASRTGMGNSGNVNLDLSNYTTGLANNTWQDYVRNLQPFLGVTGNAAQGIAGVNTGLGTGLNQSFGNQASAAYGTQAGIGNAQSQAELARSSGAQNLLGLGQSAAGLAANVLPLMFSDARVKEDIEPVGELFDGQRIYRYRYIGDATPRIGLMAQEVEQIEPDAVHDIGGIKAVDYARATEFASKLSAFMG